MHAWNREFEDFCGSHLATVLGNINKIHPELAQQFFKFIDTNPSFKAIINFFNKHDNETENLNHMQDMVLLAFYNNLLTRQQAAAILEYRGIKLNFPKVRIVDMFESYNHLSREFTELLPKFCSIFTQTTFLNLLRDKKNYECCYFIIDKDEGKIEDPRIEGTLNFANQLRAVQQTYKIIPRIEPFNDEDEAETEHMIPQINYLSLVMRDVMAQVNYGVNAKAIFPKLGIFDIDIIENYVRKKGRPFAIEYYDVISPKSFHNIEANAFYNGLHDELHRILISTIPNPVFNAYLHLIDIVREKTGLNPATKNEMPLSKGVFTRDIWDAIDMECGLFINDNSSEEIQNANSTAYFIKMMDTSVYTENRAVGLCPATSYSDTTWLVLIDMVLNSKAWKEYSIETSLLAVSDYKDLYNFIVKHQNLLLQETSPARQVAKIQSLWFILPYDDTKPTSFRRRYNHIELVHDGHMMNPTQCTKVTALNMASVYSILATPTDSPHFREMLDRSSIDWRYFDSMVLNLECFKILLEHVTNSVSTNALNIFMERKIRNEIDEATQFFNDGDFNRALNLFYYIEQIFQGFDTTMDKTVNDYIKLSEERVYVKPPKKNYSSTNIFFNKPPSSVPPENENPDETLPKKPDSLR